MTDLESSQLRLGSGSPEAQSVLGDLSYQSQAVPKSLYSSGRVFINRKITGTDDPPVGCDPVTVTVPILNGRAMCSDAGLTSFDATGFQLYDHPYDHIDYFDEEQIVDRYYSICEDFIREAIGASRVVAFDHNVRSAELQSWMNANDSTSSTIPKKIKGGNEVQSPAHVVHNDYTLTSAPLRLRLLAESPKVNDTWAKRTMGKSLIDPTELEGLLSKRFVFINVWRNISLEPIRDNPLALCDARTVDPSDLITFEIRYADRVGENYFASHAPTHRWVYYPSMTRDELLLLKVWDSAGGIATSSETQKHISTFCLHSAFKELSSLPVVPNRESIEIRTIAFFD